MASSARKARLTFNESSPQVRLTPLQPEPQVVTPNAPYRVEFERTSSTTAPAFLVADLEIQGGPWTNTSGSHGLWKTTGEKCSLDFWADAPTTIVPAGLDSSKVFVLPPGFTFRWAGSFETPATTKPPVNHIWGHLLELGPFESASSER